MRRREGGTAIQELRFSESLNLKASATRTIEFNGRRASALTRGVGGATNGAYLCSIHIVYCMLVHHREQG
jgi:hypothetical protein